MPENGALFLKLPNRVFMRLSCRRGDKYCSPSRLVSPAWFVAVNYGSSFALCGRIRHLNRTSTGVLGKFSLEPTATNAPILVPSSDIPEKAVIEEPLK
jgi:hypothetical protein